MAGEVLIPASVITGFLGSGKTTLLSHILHRPEMRDAAVIINEFGEIGLDHHLVESSDDNIVLLSSGCLCCTVRSDLVETLQDLFERRERGEVNRFNRVLIETTGLADPAPILHTLMDDAFVRRHFRLDGVLTTVDVLHALGQFGEHPESVKQVAVADRLILTKRDLVADSTISNLRKHLGAINPGAPITVADHGEIDPGQLFNVGIYDPASKGAEVTSWINAEAYGHEEHHHGDRDAHRHNDNIQAHCLIYDQPLNWRYFSPNLTSLVSRHAEKLLRVKGILNVDSEPAPVVIHGVQHQFARMRLKSWPSDDRRSKLVLIARGLDHEFLADWLSGDKLSH